MTIFLAECAELGCLKSICAESVWPWRPLGCLAARFYSFIGLTVRAADLFVVLCVMHFLMRVRVSVAHACFRTRTCVFVCAVVDVFFFFLWRHVRAG